MSRFLNCDKPPQIRAYYKEPETPDLKKILQRWIKDETIIEETIKQIQATGHTQRITYLLKDYFDLYGQNLNGNEHEVARITRELQILNSPIWPDDHLLRDYYYSRPSTDWTVWDIEREYLNILMLRKETSDFAPKKKYLKKEVLKMLNLLLECKVIYSYRRKDLFTNNTKGEMESYFRNYKTIEVQH